MADFQVKPEAVVKAELLEDDEWSEARLPERVYQQRGYEKNRTDRSGGCRNKKAEMAARACRLRRESDEHILPARLPDEPLDSYTRKLDGSQPLERQKASRTTWWSNAWNESHRLRDENEGLRRKVVELTAQLRMAELVAGVPDEPEG